MFFLLTFVNIRSNITETRTFAPFGESMNKLVVFIAFACALLGLTQTAQALDLNCSFYAPAGKYVICLQDMNQGGAIVRTCYDLYYNGYSGQYTYHWTWGGIVGGRTYRLCAVRYTATTCQVKYGGYFSPPSWYSYYNAPTFNWYNL